MILLNQPKFNQESYEYYNSAAINCTNILNNTNGDISPTFKNQVMFMIHMYYAKRDIILGVITQKITKSKARMYWARLDKEGMEATLNPRNLQLFINLSSKISNNIKKISIQ